jgi:isopentenyl diphosphate isomerase/L-lactate dehydrogenase-like FMN-dependent dehydrogenase
MLFSTFGKTLMHVPQAFGYYASGSESPSTLRDNVDSFKRYRLVPRLMVDVSKVDTTLQLLGKASPCTPTSRGKYR